MSVTTDVAGAPVVSDQAGTQVRPSAAYAWGAVLLMMLLLTSSFIDRTILGLLVKPIRTDLQITDTQFSFLTGFAFAVLYTTVGIPLGWLADRWSNRALIAGGVAVWSVMTAGCGMVSTYAALFFCRVGVGVGEATLSPCAYPLIGSYFPPNKLARPMSVYAMGIPIGMGLAMIIGGGVIEAMNAAGTVDLPILGATRPWQSVFLIVGLPGIVLALLAWVMLRDPPRPAIAVPQPSFGTVFGYMWSNRKVYGTLALSMGCFAAFSYGGTAWFPAFLMRVHGFSAGEAGSFIGLSNSVLGVAGCITAGWLADRISTRGRGDATTLIGIPYAIGMVVCAAIGPVVPNATLSLVLFAGTGFFSLTWAGVNLTALQAVTPVRMRGQVSAIYLFITNTIGLGLGPTAIAASTDYLFHNDNAVNYSIALVGFVAMTLGSIVLWLGRDAIGQRFGKAPVM